MEAGLTHLLVTWLLNWVLRGAKPDAEPSRDGRECVMRYSPRYRKLAVGLALELAAFVVLGWLLAVHEPNAGLLLLGLFGALFLLCLCCVADCFLGTVTFDTDGLTIYRIFLGSRRIEWREIDSVSYTELFWSLKIKGVGGSSGRISLGMNGLRTLVGYLHRYAPGTTALDGRRFFPLPDYLSARGMELDTK
jgi:hypothetical protein